MRVSSNPRMVFGALALFFFVFLESTLLYQTSMNVVAQTEAGSIAQFPIQGASALGLLTFSVFNRATAPKSRPRIVALLTFLGVVCLAGVAGSPSPTALVGAGCFGFFIIGLAGGSVYWAACVHLRSSKHFATYIGGSHALGIIAQIPFFSLTPNRFGEGVLLTMGIIALGIFIAKTWPEPSARHRMVQAQGLSENGHISPELESGWHLEHLTPHLAANLLVLLVLLFATLFNTLYNLVDPGQAWTSQYTEILPRIALSVGGLCAGLLFDLQRARFMGLTMFWIALISIAAIFGLQAGMPTWAGRSVFFLGSGAFITFYTTSFILIAPYFRAPALWSGMGRVISNFTSLALGAPMLLVIQSNNPPAITAAMLPLLVGINALLYAIGMLDLRVPEWGKHAAGDAEEEHGSSEAEPTNNAPQPAISPEERLAAFAVRYNLTPRECDVTAAVTADEKVLKQIAEELGISLRVLQRHLTSVYKKTDTQSRVGLTKLYWE